MTFRQRNLQANGFEPQLNLIEGQLQAINNSVNIPPIRAQEQNVSKLDRFTYGTWFSIDDV